MHRNYNIVSILCTKDHSENNMRNNVVLEQCLIAPSSQVYKWIVQQEVLILTYIYLEVLIWSLLLPSSS